MEGPSRSRNEEMVREHGNGDPGEGVAVVQPIKSMGKLEATLCNGAAYMEGLQKGFPKALVSVSCCLSREESSGREK